MKSEPNTIHWCELLTNDPDAATAFYTELLGMDSETMTMEQGGDYTIFLSGGSGRGRDHGHAGATARAWRALALERIFSSHGPLDAVVAQAVANGAHVALPPTDIARVGRIAYLLDPQGAGFGLTQPEST